MTYNWKTLQELGWAIAVAVVTYAAPVIAGANPTDFKTWGLALLAGCGRAALSAIVAFISPSGGFSAK